MKAAIFDLDGTLISSMETWGEAFIAPLIKHNISYPEDILNIVTPLGLIGVSDYYKSLGLDVSKEDLMNEIMTKIAYEYKNKIPTKPFVVEYLEKLKSQGIKMCVLTASPRELGVPCLERLDILKYFEFYMCCNEEKLTKNDTEIFERAANKLGFKIDEVTVFDDNLGAITTAGKTGAYVCGIYDVTSAHQAEEIKNNCHTYIKSFEELL